MYQLKATIAGELAPGFTVEGSFALYSAGSTIVPLVGRGKLNPVEPRGE